MAEAAGKFATGAARGSGGEKASVGVDGDGADGSLFVAAVMFAGVFVFLALQPRFALGCADHFLRLSEFDSVLGGEALGAFRAKHHVRAILESLSRGVHGILDWLASGCGV